MLYFCQGLAKGCDGLSNGCGRVCVPCMKVLDRPLGGYVILTCFWNVIVFCCAAGGAANAEVGACPDPVRTLCIVDVLLAIIHAAFGFYLQIRLVAGMKRAGMTERAMSSKELLNQAGQIALYDIGFCLYILVFMASFGINAMGLTWISNCNLATTFLPWMGAFFLVLFAMAALIFVVLWVVALCCDDVCGKNFVGMPRARRSGIFGFLFGGLLGPKNSTQSQPPAAQQFGRGGPAPGFVAQAQPAPPAYQPTAPPAGAYAAPAAAPAEKPKQTGAEQAATVAMGAAGVGIGLAGKGLGAAGTWLQAKAAKK